MNKTTARGESSFFRGLDSIRSLQFAHLISPWRIREAMKRRSERRKSTDSVPKTRRNTSSIKTPSRDSAIEEARAEECARWAAVFASDEALDMPMMAAKLAASTARLSPRKIIEILATAGHGQPRSASLYDRMADYKGRNPVKLLPGGLGGNSHGKGIEASWERAARPFMPTK